MFDLISNSMLFLLQSLKSIVGDYGWAIIALTLLTRVVLWPVSQSQMKSMQMMQAIQPKLKQIQERYKTEPQKLQAEMMKLYQEHKFNPLGGCLPMLVQIPIFIGLYWAVSSPNFLSGSDPVFLNFFHLNHTSVMSHSGPSHDGKIAVTADSGSFFGAGKDHVIAANEMTLDLKNGQQITKKIKDANNALTILPKDYVPGVDLTITTDFTKLGLEGYEDQVNAIEFDALNSATKEAEHLRFIPTEKSQVLETKLPTVAGKTVFHWDVLVLIVVFAGSMLLSQKMMQGQTSGMGNDQQQQMMKFLPLMFTGFLFIFPIPAGVLLYMDTNSLFQIFQTWWFQRTHPVTAAAPSGAIVDVAAH